MCEVPNGEISGVQSGVANQEGGELRLSGLPRRKQPGAERKEGINRFKCHGGTPLQGLLVSSSWLPWGPQQWGAGCGSQRVTRRPAGSGERDGGHRGQEGTT